MKYHNITHDDMNNGDGLRVVLWVSGCEHHCKGCQNPVTWNPDDGLVFGKRERKDVNYHWAGSINQRVIDVPQTLKEGKVVLYESH